MRCDWLLAVLMKKQEVMNVRRQAYEALTMRYRPAMRYRFSKFLADESSVDFVAMPFSDFARVSLSVLPASISTNQIPDGLIERFASQIPVPLFGSSLEMSRSLARDEGLMGSFWQSTHRRLYQPAVPRPGQGLERPQSLG